MKRILFLCLLFIFGKLSIYPLNGWFVGLGLEANAHSREAVAGGCGLSLGLQLDLNFSFGIKALVSNNFDRLSSFEPMIFLRYYPPLYNSGLFIQTESGAVVYMENGQSYPVFSNGLGIGWRFELGKRFYVDPVIRGGYPFLWGVGVTAGIKNRKKDMEDYNFRILR